MISGPIQSIDLASPITQGVLVFDTDACYAGFSGTLHHELEWHERESESSEFWQLILECRTK